MNSKQSRPAPAANFHVYLPGLGILLTLFAFRVAVQAVQAVRPVSFLPPFGAWQSGTLPYSILLVSQIVLLVIMGAVHLRIYSGKMRPRSSVGSALLSLGSIYFALAVFRLATALSFGAEHPFLGAILPSVFHVVLSLWFVLLGWFHHRESQSRSPVADDIQPGYDSPLVCWLVYPLLITGGIWLHFLLQSRELSLLWSTYLPIAVGTLLVTWLEKVLPHRREWKPDRKEVKNDLAFLTLVQMLLPKALAFLVALTALRWLHSQDLFLEGLWPQDLPPLLQAGLMILVADFFRYWLHRACHEWSDRLWSLHAVHHSPKKLYWVNVGRFHPLEKALQFLFDAAPFILLGVSEEVLALYFVFYALNGFIQHCNIQLRLGWLNYLVSGPELHRWHHSWEIRESNRNYGNNLIVWDLLFGSFFLPRDREVDRLGLKNRDYPKGFLVQMKTPFHKGLDKEES